MHLAATDPANPYGALLRWPAPPGRDGENRGPTRSVGALVILVNGRLGRTEPRRQADSVYLPESEPARSITARAVAERLFALATSGSGGRRGLLVSEVDGVAADAHPLAPFLLDAGFVKGAMGFQASPKPRG